MRTSPVVLLLLAAGCARPAPVVAPAPAPAPAPPAAAEAPAPAPAEVTCADAGVLLRGVVDDQRQAGPAKEAVIARTCRYEKWPASVLGCVGARPRARSCLDKLTAAQRAAHAAALMAWNEDYPDEVLGEDDPGDDDQGMDSYVDCGDAIDDVSGFTPAVTLTGDTRDYVLELRKEELLLLCEDWEPEQRVCFRELVEAGTASRPAAVDACRAQLEPAHARAVTDKLAALDRLGAKLAALKTRAASHDCKKVVAAHYADAAWKGTMVAMKGAERAKVITESRARMTRACAAERWSANLRACLIAGGGAVCFTSSPSSASAWGFPAAGVYMKIGIPECDAYTATIKALDACAAITPAQRDTVKRPWGYLSVSWANTPPERQAQAAQTCKQFDEVARRAAVTAGCKI